MEPAVNTTQTPKNCPTLQRTPATALRMPHAAANDIIPTGDPRLSYLHPRVVGELSDRLRAHTIECVMETFGISFNTWLKIRKGQPIRKSVAERLASRARAG